MIVIAGVPFGTPGSTNVLHVVRIIGDELKGYAELGAACGVTTRQPASDVALRRQAVDEPER